MRAAIVACLVIFSAAKHYYLEQILWLARRERLWWAEEQNVFLLSVDAILRGWLTDLAIVLLVALNVRGYPLAALYLSVLNALFMAIYGRLEPIFLVTFAIPALPFILAPRMDLFLPGRHWLDQHLPESEPPSRAHRTLSIALFVAAIGPVGAVLLGYR